MLIHPHLINIQLLDHLVLLSHMKSFPKYEEVKIHMMVPIRTKSLEILLHWLVLNQRKVYQFYCSSAYSSDHTSPQTSMEPN